MEDMLRGHGADIPAQRIAIRLPVGKMGLGCYERCAEIGPFGNGKAKGIVAMALWNDHAGHRQRRIDTAQHVKMLGFQNGRIDKKLIAEAESAARLGPGHFRWAPSPARTSLGMARSWMTSVCWRKPSISRCTK